MSETTLNRATRRKITRLLGTELAKTTRAVILVIGGIKGGIGKSTTAILLAHVWAAMGLKVLVIDADPKSGTSRKWNRRAREAGTPLPFDVQTHPSEDLEDRIADEEWHLTYDLIIIDTGGDNDRILQAAYRIADSMLFTASPSPVDLDTLADTARTAIGKAGQERDIPTAFLLTAVKSDRMAKDAKTAMRNKGLPVLATVVKHRTAYQNAYGLVPERLFDYPAVQYELDHPREELTA